MSRGKASRKPGQLRIIGGQWRGRRLELAPDTGIRPTGDRIRETLFNWLTPVIEGARCLDLFAGSGALGLEALSRGAGEAVFIERDAEACSRLEAAMEKFGCRNARVTCGDAVRFLRGAPPSQGFDIVFLDPPFGAMSLSNLCTLIDAGWLSAGARIYVETSRHDDLRESPSTGSTVGSPIWPPAWTLERDKTAGQVHYMLFRRTRADANADERAGE
jgi:16S rRNA (guanine966-N2)-methyltransferase